MRALLPWVLAACFLHLLLWAGAFTLVRTAPALDSAEQLAWASALEAGYWKHPPLPTWLLHGLVALFGPSVALTYIATQAAVAIALGLAWWFGCAFLSPARSFVAMLLSALVVYHGAGADAFNHTVLLLPFQAAVILATHRAARSGSLALWLLAGVVAGLAMLVKYVAVFTLFALAVAVACDRTLWTRRNAAGMVLATIVSLLVFLPHLQWLRANDWWPLRYAETVSTPVGGVSRQLRNLLGFTGTQLGRLAPLLVAAGLVLRWRDSAASGVSGSTAQQRADRRFLWIVALVPLATMMLYALVTQTQLLARWGGGAFLLVGWLAVDLARGVHWRRVAGVVVALQLVACVALVVAPALWSQGSATGRPRFPGPALAAEVDAVWARAGLAGPIPILVADTWLAGNYIAQRAPVPVLVDGVFFRSPWITPAQFRACGAMVLEDRAGLDPVEPGVTKFMQAAAAKGEFVLRDARHPEAPPLRIGWGVVGPDDSGVCPLR